MTFQNSCLAKCLTQTDSGIWASAWSNPSCTPNQLWFPWKPKLTSFHEKHKPSVKLRKQRLISFSSLLRRHRTWWKWEKSQVNFPLSPLQNTQQENGWTSKLSPRPNTQQEMVGFPHFVESDLQLRHPWLLTMKGRPQLSVPLTAVVVAIYWWACNQDSTHHRPHRGRATGRTKFGQTHLQPLLVLC